MPFLLFFYVACSEKVPLEFFLCTLCYILNIQKIYLSLLFSILGTVPLNFGSRQKLQVHADHEARHFTPEECMEIRPEKMAMHAKFRLHNHLYRTGRINGGRQCPFFKIFWRWTFSKCILVMGFTKLIWSFCYPASFLKFQNVRQCQWFRFELLNFNHYKLTKWTKQLAVHVTADYEQQSTICHYIFFQNLFVKKNYII